PFHASVYYPYPGGPDCTQGTHSSAGIPSFLNSPSLSQHLEGECCSRCRSPLDPALAKLFRLAQLTVEWLLHCQAALAEHLGEAERRLAAAGGERERLEEQARAFTKELKQRKKVICTQQIMLGPQCVGSHKCPHCDKSFINSSFLQNHLQRRHPDEFEMQQSRSDSEKKSQLDVLKEKEQETLHRDLVRELDRFKAEEMARTDRKIEDIRREMEFLYTRNFQARIVSRNALSLPRVGLML
ncbi:hypothetical protein NHX12_014917, partial [Muraenolepis orangiensis]